MTVRQLISQLMAIENWEQEVIAVRRVDRDVSYSVEDIEEGETASGEPAVGLVLD